MKHFLFKLLLFISFSGIFTQPVIGQTLTHEIVGSVAQDRCGHVSMPNSSTIAVGARLNDQGGSNNGQTRIFEYSSGSWSLKGNVIYGENNSDYSGETLSMPDDNTIAIGAKDNDGNGKSNCGHVRVFTYSSTSNTWSQKGGDIDGEAANDKSSISMEMSDANTIAIGAYYNDGNGSNSGQVRVYRFNGTNWLQRGVDIDGSASNDKFGISVSMPDSNLFAAGAIENDGNGSNSGSVDIYTWNGTSWANSATFYGDNAGDQLGCSISMPDKNTIAMSSKVYNSNTGYVKIFKFDGTNWNQMGTNIVGESSGDYSGISISMPNSNTIAIGAKSNAGVNGSASGHVRIYSWNGTSWNQVGSDIDGENSSDNSGEFICMPDANTVAIGAIYNDDNGSSSGHVRIWDLTNKWTGNGNITSTSNWSLGTIPIATDSVEIISGNLTINQNTTLDKVKMEANTSIVLGGNLEVNTLTNLSSNGVILNGYDLTIGNATNMNGIGGATSLYLEGNSQSNISIYDQNDHDLYLTNSKIILESLNVHGSGSSTIDVKNNLEISKAVSCTGGTLSVNGNLLLLSDASQTAYVAESSGTITTTSTTVQQYIPGRRVFRFLAHPFSSAIALSQLTDDIDITGTGGATNGFTATVNNNPSAYYFDVSAADNTSSGLNPGWTDFSNTTSNSWGKASPALIYIRGAKGEGIDGVAYTPSAVTLDMTGSINTGSQTISLSKGTNSTFVTVGNPYPSPIQMQSVTSAKRSNIGSTYWVFDANLGANGGYVSKLWDTDSYVLPAYAGFATEVSANGSITFEESHKTTATPANIFLGGSNGDDLKLNVFVNNHLYDQTRLVINNQAASIKDYFDGAKMENADINFFTISEDGKQLSIDSRTFDLETESIALGLSSNASRDITIQTDASAFLDAHQVTLIDHYTDKTYNLNEGVAVNLNIDLNKPKTYGTERLELLIQKIQNGTQPFMKVQSSVFPNPSTTGNDLTVQANAPIQNISVSDLSGRLIWNYTPESKTNLSEIPADIFTRNGVYLIDIQTSLGRKTHKHIVQF